MHRPCSDPGIAPGAPSTKEREREENDLPVVGPLWGLSQNTTATPFREVEMETREDRLVDRGKQRELRTRGSQEMTWIQPALKQSLPFASAALLCTEGKKRKDD